MASIGESYDIIGKLLENDGVYPGDPQAYELSSYLNNWGGRTFHISMNERDTVSLYTSPFCKDIRLLWNRERGLTQEGTEVLKKYNEIRSHS